jgi:uncharacterized protein (DUF3084 family)
MKTLLTRNIKWLAGTLLSTAAMAGLLLFTGAPCAAAEEHDCQKRIAKADHNLHEAIEHHGRASQEAEHARHELQEARAHCWSTEHRWWDEDSQRWHSERDWDDRDHDQDRDRDHDHDHDHQ